MNIKSQPGRINLTHQKNFLASAPNFAITIIRIERHLDIKARSNYGKPRINTSS